MTEGVRPNEFEEEVSPSLTSFEVYSQYGGTNRRSLLSNVKKVLAAVVRGAVAYIPTPSGNATNRMEFVTDPNGQVWYIDASGAAVKLGGGTPPHLYEDFGLVTGTTITPTIDLPTTGKEWRLNLYRGGVRMTYGKDYSESMGVITLILSADSEPFTLTVIPE